MGRLVGVYLLMPNEGREAEGLAAAAALVWPQPGVHSVVLDQVGAVAVAEGLAALRAHVGPLPGVRALVQRERRALAEGLAAVPALEGLIAGVDLLVLEEGGHVAEGGAALQELVGPGARVSPGGAASGASSS